MASTPSNRCQVPQVISAPTTPLREQTTSFRCELASSQRCHERTYVATSTFPPLPACLKSIARFRRSLRSVGWRHKPVTAASVAAEDIFRQATRVVGLEKKKFPEATKRLKQNKKCQKEPRSAQFWMASTEY